MKFVNECRIVSKNEVVIQKGERAGEVVYRLAVASADGESSLVDIPAKISAEVFSALKLFVQEYAVIFDYAVKSFNGRSYTDFSIVGILAPPAQTAPAEKK